MRHGSRIDPVALDLIQRHGPSIMGTARRYSASADDAEDAYQRGLEILLTKAPSTHEAELVPWLRTVVKHEAFALRRQRERTPLSDDGEVDGGPGAAATHEQAERYERLRLGAEALRRLKPQEVRCLLLKAEGYSYRQICEETGFSYTKVNRCLTEGRASFLERVAGIESGEECDRLRPLLSLLADGEASAEDMAALRPHLKGCLACRAALKEYRAAPERVAALVPPVALAGEADAQGGIGHAWDAMADWFHERALAVGMKLHGAVHQVAELGSAQKVAAVAATAAIAGGGTAAVQSSEPPSGPRPAAVEQKVVAEREPEPPAPAPQPTVPATPPAPAPDPPPANEPKPAEEKAAKPEPQPQPAPAAQEFAPSPPPVAEPAPAEPVAEEAPRRTPASSGGPSEFGP